MTVRTSMSQAVCPVARSLDLLGDPWTLLILREVFSGNRRFDGIKAALGVPDTVLSNRLQRLVDEGLLDCSPYRGTVRPGVDYILTEAGEDTLPMLHALARGAGHTPRHLCPAVGSCWWSVWCRATVAERRLVPRLRGAT